MRGESCFDDRDVIGGRGTYVNGFQERVGLGEGSQGVWMNDFPPVHLNATTV